MINTTSYINVFCRLIIKHKKLIELFVYEWIEVFYTTNIHCKICHPTIIILLLACSFATSNFALIIYYHARWANSLLSFFGVWPLTLFSCPVNYVTTNRS